MTKIREVNGFTYVDRDMTETEQEQFDIDYANGLAALVLTPSSSEA